MASLFHQISTIPIQEITSPSLRYQYSSLGPILNPESKVHRGVFWTSSGWIILAPRSLQYGLNPQYEKLKCC